MILTGKSIRSLKGKKVQFGGLVRIFIFVMQTTSYHYWLDL